MASFPQSMSRLLPFAFSIIPGAAPFLFRAISRRACVRLPPFPLPFLPLSFPCPPQEALSINLPHRYFSLSCEVSEGRSHPSITARNLPLPRLSSLPPPPPPPPSIQARLPTAQGPSLFAPSFLSHSPVQKSAQVACFPSAPTVLPPPLHLRPFLFPSHPPSSSFA